MMIAPALLTVALLLWTLGAGVYTIQLWKARGLTDNGFLGLGLLILGSTAMAISLRETPTLAACGLVPAYFAAAILVTKVRCAVRTRWRKPPAMLSREPERLLDMSTLPLRPLGEETYDGARGSTWMRPDPPIDTPDVGQVVDETFAKAEAERAQRVGRMFG